MNSVYRLPCPKCGSSDAVTEYDNHTHCYSCGDHVFKTIEEEKEEMVETSQSFVTRDDSPHNDALRLKDKDEDKRPFQDINGDFRVMEDRKISLSTAKRYKVFRSPNSNYTWVYPQYRNGTHTANKYRWAGDKKGFIVEGEWSKLELFGQSVFPAGSARAITVTEGYDDAMAAYELTGSKYPCVSIHSVATASKDCAENYEYLNSFPEIVLCFDRDDPKTMPDGTKRYPGQDAAQEVAAMFPAKKVRVLTLSKHKDANDYLRENLHQTFTDEWFKAAVWVPQGIRLGSDLWDDIRTQKNHETVPYPWDGLNELTYGIRLSEFVVITADTGVGKTSILKEIEHYLLKHTTRSVGFMHLEEPNSDTGLGLMSIEANKPLHLPDVREKVDEDELKIYYDKVVNTERVIIYDHFGSNDIGDLLNKIRHMHALGAKYIVLDHLSIVVSDQTGDERKQLDEISTKIKTLCMELNIAVLAVIHQNRAGQIRGTAGVEQLANIVIKLFRDKEEEDPFRRNVTKVLVQKNRFCGRTGPACYLKYDSESGRLSECSKQEIIQYESGQQEPVQEVWSVKPD